MKIADTFIYNYIKKIYIQMRASFNRIVSPSQLTLNSINKYSEKFGFDRGTPIDRYYIDEFIRNLELNNEFNTALEFGELNYVEQFNVSHKFFLSHPDFSKSKDTKNQILFDLNTQKKYDGQKFDLIISTNVINFTKNPFVTLRHHIDMLNIDGTIFLTASSSMPISQFDAERWGDYWRFTPDAMHHLLENLDCEYQVESLGNFKSSVAFLCGLASEEMEESDLKEKDNRYPLLVVALIKKKRYSA